MVGDVGDHAVTDVVDGGRQDRAFLRLVGEHLDRCGGCTEQRLSVEADGVAVLASELREAVDEPLVASWWHTGEGSSPNHGAVVVAEGDNDTDTVLRERVLAHVVEPVGLERLRDLELAEPCRNLRRREGCDVEVALLVRSEPGVEVHGPILHGVVELSRRDEAGEHDLVGHDGVVDGVGRQVQRVRNQDLGVEQRLDVIRVLPVEVGILRQDIVRVAVRDSCRGVEATVELALALDPLVRGSALDVRRQRPEREPPLVRFRLEDVVVDVDVVALVGLHDHTVGDLAGGVRTGVRVGLGLSLAVGVDVGRGLRTVVGVDAVAVLVALGHVDVLVNDLAVQVLVVPFDSRGFGQAVCDRIRQGCLTRSNTEHGDTHQDTDNCSLPTHQGNNHSSDEADDCSRDDDCEHPVRPPLWRRRGCCLDGLKYILSVLQAAQANHSVIT